MKPARQPDRAQAHGSPKPLYAQRRIAQLAARWDAKAQSWDQALQDPTCHLNEDDAYQRFVRHLRALVRRRQAFCARNGIIEFGCGTGLVLEKVVGDFAWALGVDISRAMLRQARRKRLPNTRFIVGDCFNLKQPSPPAGVVCSRGVLLSHYGPQHAPALLHAAWAALLPGGYALFDFLNAGARGLHTHSPNDKFYLTPQQACAFANRAGFEVARVLGTHRRRVLILCARKAA